MIKEMELNRDDVLAQLRYNQDLLISLRTFDMSETPENVRHETQTSIEGLEMGMELQQILLNEIEATIATLGSVME